MFEKIEQTGKGKDVFVHQIEPTDKGQLTTLIDNFDSVNEIDQTEERMRMSMREDRTKEKRSVLT